MKIYINIWLIEINIIIRFVLQQMHLSHRIILCNNLNCYFKVNSDIT